MVVVLFSFIVYYIYSDEISDRDYRLIKNGDYPNHKDNAKDNALKAIALPLVLLLIMLYRDYNFLNIILVVILTYILALLEVWFFFDILLNKKRGKGVNYYTQPSNKNAAFTDKILYIVDKNTKIKPIPFKIALIIINLIFIIICLSL